MGWRGTTSTALNFGDNGECVGYLVGKPHHGLSYMFQMMNEARIGVGMGAVMLGYAGYLYSLEYARERPQGRVPDSKDPTTAPVAIIQHADVRRMLLTQKAYVEGSFDLGLYAARLFDDTTTLDSEAERQRAHELLDLLTPIVKSWPSEFCLKANELAIQILGGHGYTREYPVEQYYRDNRLNPIHEGTHGIQSLDLLGRKLAQNGGAGLKQLIRLVADTTERAQAHPSLTPLRQPITMCPNTFRYSAELARLLLTLPWPRSVSRPRVTVCRRATSASSGWRNGVSDACAWARSVVSATRRINCLRPAPPFCASLRPSRSRDWMPWVPSWIGFKRLSR